MGLSSATKEVDDQQRRNPKRAMGIPKEKRIKF
jgi:hypothetical protein